MALPNIGMFYELEVRGRSAEVERRTFENVLQQVQLADQLGYHAVWFVEHHFTKGFSHSSAPDIMLAALSRVTEQIRLGLGVVLLPFSHPVRTAERVATLDVVSGGRIEFGTGRGASPLEYQAFHMPFERSRQIWEDNLDAVLSIWRADTEPVSIEHEYWSVPEVSVFPRPIQRPHPPVWVASTSLDGFLAAAKLGYNLLCMPLLKGLDDLAEDISAYKACLAENGFDPDERRIGLLVPWAVGETEDEALESTDALIWYINRQVNLVIPPNYYDARHATYKVFGQLAAGLPPEDAVRMLRKHRMVVVDDHAGSRKALEEFAAAGATDVLCQFQVGGLDHELVSRSIRQFATNVAGLKPVPVGQG